MSVITFRQIWDGQPIDKDLSLADKFKPGGFFDPEVQEVWRVDPAIVWLRKQGYPEETQVYVGRSEFDSITVILCFTVPEEILTYIIMRWPVEKLTISQGCISHAKLTRLCNMLGNKNGKTKI